MLTTSRDAFNELSECHISLPELKIMRLSGWDDLVAPVDVEIRATPSPPLVGQHRALQRTEAVAEGELLLVGDVLLVEHQDGIVVEQPDNVGKSAALTPAAISTPCLRQQCVCKPGEGIAIAYSSGGPAPGTRSVSRFLRPWESVLAPDMVVAPLAAPA